MTTIFEMLMIKIFIGIIIIGIVGNFIYFYNSTFEKDIVVKEKYITTTYSKYSNTTNYFIVSNDDKIYNVVDVWWKGDFNEADDYAKLDVGKTYRVKGYGIRVPFLGMYHKIYDIGL